MAKEPLLPGFVFEQTQGKRFHLNQNFNIVNGISIPRLQINQFPDLKLAPSFRLNEEFQPYNLKNDFTEHDLLLKESMKNKKCIRKVFTPHYVIHDGKCLSFRGYFKEPISEYGSEKQLLYHKVNIIYYLEDDSMTIIEPPIPNSGYPQGRLVRRGKVPKPYSSEHWHWKDLNVGMDLEAHGIIYHICSCDEFTQEYLNSQGIEVNQSEEIPINEFQNNITGHRKHLPYNAHRDQIPFSQDKLYKFLQYDRKVLRFYACWCEQDNINDQAASTTRYKIYYYLIDDTVEIRESLTRFSPDQMFKKFLGRTKLPKNNKCGPVAVQNLALSYTNTDNQEYYRPEDFLIGTYIHVLGRKFFIYDCDDYTRTYFRELLKIEQPTSIDIPMPKDHPQPIIKEIAAHTGIGQPEDTLQSCLSIVPRPPRKDVMHYIENVNKYLRYSAKLNSSIADDKEREFIMQYSLADGKISIYEVRVPNSGFTPGSFLKSALVPKMMPHPSSSSHQIEYYTPNDFIIGNAVTIFGRKFLITGADLAVYRYLETKKEKYGTEALNSVKDYLKRKGITADINDDECAPDEN